MSKVYKHPNEPALKLDIRSLSTRIQENADQVEKSILHTENLLKEDTGNEQKGLPMKHQDHAAEIISHVEVLLKDLFLDVHRVKTLQHPQADEIELHIKNIHERWYKDCEKYKDLYKQPYEQTLMPTLDRSKLPSEKQIQEEKSESVPEQLLHTLDDLDRENLKRFRWYLKQDGSISVSRLENADVPDIVDKMLECYGQNGALNKTLAILKKMKQNNLAEQLGNNGKEGN
ncbi:envoplakin-like [Xyrauchen texanus]|uniref:envoplakin-like n=1 Tax=Xyrauchen texanus TaxID=154827 RepID=UPI002241D543|nr:envoplakin-like [Xyrauchen texanus]XP_051988966.1 envoplakin-like [Xyrauchen texanus]